MRKTRIRHATPRCIELYYLNNRGVGFVSFDETYFDKRNGDSVSLFHMRITHDSQRQGYGSILMNAALKVHGHKTIRLIARPDWDCDLPGLVRFFKRFGFKVNGYVHPKAEGPAEWARMTRKAKS